MITNIVESTTPRGNYLASLLMLQDRGFTPRTMIDVGAAEGGFFLARARARLFPQARHFFVDAMAENEPLYRKFAKFHAGYEIAALAGAEGTVNLRIDPEFYNTHIDSLQPQTRYEQVRAVPMTTLDALVARHKLEPPFAIKIDVQGAELDVLRGALRTLSDAIVVTTEIQILGSRDTLVELLGFMHGNAWALYDLTDQAYYPSDGTMYQCYTTFIPRSKDFRGTLEWATDEQKKLVAEEFRKRRAELTHEIDELLRG